MFSIQHIIWFCICLIAIILTMYLLLKYKPSIKNVLTVACILRVIGDMVKVFSTIEMIPNSAGTAVYPYLKLQFLPLHLCGLQIVFLFYARFTKNETGRKAALAFMYPTCTIGGFLSLILPSIFTDSISLSQAFTHPLAYQFFLYHTMLVIVGLYIALSKEVKLNTKSYFQTLLILFATAYLSIYINSMCAVPTYINNELISVDYMTNFFNTIVPPIDITLTTIEQWFTYIIIMILIAIILMAIFYIPFFIKDYKEEQKN